MAEGAGVNQPNRGVLITLFVLAQVVGITILILIGFWVRDYLGGFAWSGKTQFNWHPFLMALSLLYLYGTSAVVYRVFPNMKKLTLKIIHATLHGIAIVGIVVALIAVFEFHNNFNIPNLYSLHSWVGIITVALFVFQYVFGFIFYLIRGLRDEVRAQSLPYHRFIGIAVLLLAGAATLSGLTEKVIFSLGDKYQSLPSPGLFVNFCGILIIIFLLLLLYILIKPEWMRKASDESTRLMDSHVEQQSQE